MNTIVCNNTGTTNTCVSVWRGGEILHASHSGTGVRDTAITGNKDKLIAGIRHALYCALDTCEISASSVDFIMATGMISSEMGILEVPHIELPVGLETLSLGLVWKTIPEIIECPIAFVPGVKYRNESGRCIDFMRGEEIETFGLIDRLGINDSCIVLLPGSHCKCVYVGRNGKLVRSDTMLSGELLDAITSHTILAGSTQRKFTEYIQREHILSGAEAAEKYGITKACFQIRIMEKNGEHTRNDLANFLLGVVTYYDVYTLKHLMDPQRPQEIYIAGNPNVSEAYEILLKSYYGQCCNVTTASPAQMECLSAHGAMLIAKKKGLCE